MAARITHAVDDWSDWALASDDDETVPPIVIEAEGGMQRKKTDRTKDEPSPETEDEEAPVRPSFGANARKLRMSVSTVARESVKEEDGEVQPPKSQDNRKPVNRLKPDPKISAITSLSSDITATPDGTRRRTRGDKSEAGVAPPSVARPSTTAPPVAISPHRQFYQRLKDLPRIPQVPLLQQVWRRNVWELLRGGSKQQRVWTFGNSLSSASPSYNQGTKEEGKETNAAPKDYTEADLFNSHTSQRPLPLIEGEFIIIREIRQNSKRDQFSHLISLFAPLFPSPPLQES